MQNLTLRHQLTNYLDHLMEAPWLASLVEEHGLPVILATVTAVLTDGTQDEILGALLFVRDLGQNINNWAAPIIDEVRETLPITVLPAVRPLLYSPFHDVRRNAIYTLGKLCYRKEAKALRGAFPWYVDHDPLSLPDLMSELAWLGDERGFEVRLRRMLAHPSYLVRWSILDGFSSLESSRGSSLRWKQVSKVLSNDVVAAVRDEALFLLAEARLRRDARKARSLPKPEWQRRGKALAKQEPAVTFFRLKLQFENELARRGQADYSVDELLAFAKELGVSAPG